MLIHKLTLDVEHPERSPNFDLKKGDTRAHKLVISIVQNGKSILSEKYTYEFNATKPDGNTVFNICRFEEGKVVYELEAQVATCLGIVTAEIVVSDETGMVLCTPTFNINVLERALDDDGLISSSDMSGFREYIQRSYVAATNSENSAQNSADSATAAEESATCASESAGEASEKAEEAAYSAIVAAEKAEAASKSATESANSAKAASGSATTATEKAEEAASSASSALTQAKDAEGSAGEALLSANEAAASAREAKDSEKLASTKATAASNSAASAEASAVEASNSAASAEASVAEVNKSASEASNSATAAATSAKAASGSATTATEKAEEAASSASAASGSANTAEESATAAANSEENALGYANNASSSASTASAKATAASNSAAAASSSASDARASAKAAAEAEANAKNIMSGATSATPYGNGSGGISVGTGLTNSANSSSESVVWTPSTNNGAITTTTYRYSEYYCLKTESKVYFGKDLSGKDLDEIYDSVTFSASSLNTSSGTLNDRVDYVLVGYNTSTRKSYLMFLCSDPDWLQEYLNGVPVTVTMKMSNKYLYQTVLGEYNVPRSGGKETVPILAIGNGTSSAKSNALRLTYTSQMYLGTGGKYNSTGADYGEYFEWLDKNPENEDRRGLFVTCKEGKIKIAGPEDRILGAVSKNASVIGNSDEGWQGRWLKDEFGEVLYEIVIRDGEYVKEPAENPDFDDSRDYIPRSNRPEWAVIGMLGRVRVRDNGMCETDAFAKVAENGMAIPSEDETGFYVLERISENVIEILMK